MGAELKKFWPFKPGYVAKEDNPFLEMLPEASIAPAGKFRLMHIFRKRLTREVTEFMIVGDFEGMEAAALAIPIFPEQGSEYGVYDENGKLRIFAR